MSASEAHALHDIFGFFPQGLESMKAVVAHDPCAYCGRPRGGTMDHIEPCLRGSRHRGGRRNAGSLQNLTAACERCNSTKGATSLLQFLLKSQEVRVP